MPKTFSEVDRKKWLELFESGKTVKGIAREARCDFRTVKRGVDDARRMRESMAARTELYKDALRKHQNSLLREMEGIFSSIEMPTQDFAPLSWQEGRNSILSPSHGADERQAGEAVRPDKEELTLMRLLREHLRNDRMWKVVGLWQKANDAHISSRIALQRKTKSIIEEKTGFKLVGNFVPAPYVFSHTTGQLFFKDVLDHVFGIANGSNIEQNIVVDRPNSGMVAYHNSVLAEAPGDGERARKNLLAALRELKASPEAACVVETYRLLEEAAAKARRAIQEITLLGIIPGQCQICHRLGM